MLSRWIKLAARRRQMNLSTRRRASHGLAGPAEFHALEPRVLMSVTAMVDVDGALSVSSDADDALVITVDGVSGNVLVNGVDPGSGAFAAASVTSINVTGGPLGNMIDLSLVTAAGFTSLTDGSVIINAGDGNDTIIGSELGDVITGGAGDDSIDGGLGADVLVETITAAAAVTLTDTTFDGNGTDTLAGIEEAQITGTAGNDTISAATFTGVVTIDGLAGDDTLTGGAGNDTLNGGDGDDTLAGGAGDDTLVGGLGVNSIDGGAGADTVTFDDAAGRVHAKIKADGTGDARVNVTGQRRPVERTSLTSIETLIGSAFNDHLVSCLDGVTLRGGDGDDRLQARNADGNTLDGGAGDDRLHARGLLSTLTGGFGNDRLRVVLGDNHTLDGGDGDDRIWGGRGIDLINGGDGNDRIWGGSGNDMITAGLGDDQVHGGGGNDDIDGGDGIDRIFGRSGDDLLAGGIGDDFLHGGSGADTLDGGDGNDTIRSDANDTLV